MNKLIDLSNTFNIPQDKLEEFLRNKYNSSNISHTYSYPLLDIAVGKHRNGIRLHLYGRPGSGKTAIAANFAIWNAIINNNSVLWIDAGGHAPHLFLANQLINQPVHFYICNSLSLEEMILASTYFDLIIVDDLTSCEDNVKHNISRFTSSCGRYQTKVVYISQVRQDIFGTKDLIPETAITNSDLVANIVRAEQVDNESYRYRYNFSIKSYRGKLNSKVVSFEIDYNGLYLSKLIYQIAIRNHYYNRVGVKIKKNGEILGEFKELSILNRHNYKKLADIWKEMYSE